MIIDCISDLHGYYPTLEGGDLLIVAGDLTARDEKEQYEEFFNWMKNQEYRKKVFICGNHDNQAMSQFDWYDAEYLCDSGTEVVTNGNRLKIWGSPWSSTFKGMNPHCKAFTCDTEEELAVKFSLIPEDVDILITHSPSHGILDSVLDQSVGFENEYTRYCGSISLREKFFQIKPKLHVFGHIHEWGGKSIDLTTSICINASIVNEKYEHVNKPVRVIL